MESLALLFSSHGRIARKPFVLAVLLVYVLIVASQLLLSKTVIARLNILPFALAQGLLLFCWYALHTKRLRDTGHGTGAATGIAVLNTLSVVLFLLLLELMLGISAMGIASKKEDQELVAVLFIIFLLALFSPGNDPISAFYILSFVVLGMIALSPVIAAGFSLWLGTRASAPQPP
jgi:uncharacterized membrane protein YhaH (DUF805 family)